MITDKSSMPRTGGADQPRPSVSQPSDASSGFPSAAVALAPLLRNLLGERIPVRFELWDGSSIGSQDGAGIIHVRSADALRRILWAPGELGVGRGYVAGDIEVEGDIIAMLASLHEVAPRTCERAYACLPAAFAGARHAGAIGLPLPAPAEEARVAGFRHSRRRDVQAVTHHYDVGNDFYELVLGPSMTYSCARFADPEMSLEQAQESKHDLICRKLGLRDGKPLRLLDVGCGWGSMAMHAAASCDATVVGITLSDEQASYARKRVADAGLSDRVEIRVQDYRDLRGERFDAISSIGMFEHVGKVRTGEYFETLHGLLAPGGRLLNHAISGQGDRSSGLGASSVATCSLTASCSTWVMSCLRWNVPGSNVVTWSRSGSTTPRTLRCWVANLEANWETAVKQVGLCPRPDLEALHGRVGRRL